MGFSKFKKLVSVTGLAVGLTLAAGSAQSAALYSFEDDDIDFIVRTIAGTPTLVTSGPILVGDVFVSALEVPVFTINGVNAIPTGQELTGVAAIQLLGCTFGGVPAPCNGPVGTQFIFGAPTLGLNAYLAIGTDPDASVGAAGAAGGGAMVALFLNGTSGAGGDINLDLNRSSNPATNCISLADCIDQASRGTLFQVDGFTGDPDDFWQATLVAAGAGSIDTVAGTSNSTLVATANFGLGTFFNLNGPVTYSRLSPAGDCGNPGFALDGCMQFIGSATITGGEGLVNGAFAHSDFDAIKRVTVPEPGTLALLGLGLAGFGFGASRGKKVTAA